MSTDDTLKRKSAFKRKCDGCGAERMPQELFQFLTAASKPLDLCKPNVRAECRDRLKSYVDGATGNEALAGQHYKERLMGALEGRER